MKGSWKASGRDRALQGDFSDTWAPTAEDAGATSSRNDDVFSNYIKTFELCDETVEGYPQEQFTAEEIEQVRRKLEEQDQGLERERKTKAGRDFKRKLEPVVEEEKVQEEEAEREPSPPRPQSPARGFQRYVGTHS